MAVRIDMGELDENKQDAWKRLGKKLERIVKRVQGQMGVAVEDIQTGARIGIAAHQSYPMASVCKTPILVAAYRQAEAGTLDLNKRLTFVNELRVPGSGLFNFFDAGFTPTLRDLLLMMIVVSDNAATDCILHELGGPPAVTRAMRELGLNDIQLDRTIRQLVSDIHIAIEPSVVGLDMEALDVRLAQVPYLAARFRDPKIVLAAVETATHTQDVATPADIAGLYAQIARQQCASAVSCEAILQTLGRQQLRTRLPRELPPGVKVCHKTGSLGIGTVANDTGLMYIADRSAAIAVLSRSVTQEPAVTNTAIARIGRAVYDYFASNLSVPKSLVRASQEPAQAQQGRSA